MKNFMKELRSPKPESRGLTRWWWYGAAVKKEEIVEQLDEMASNGIGGVEIQMLYPLSMETDDRKCIAYFSPEYFDILEFTKRETEKRGMIFDLTLGHHAEGCTDPGGKLEDHVSDFRNLPGKSTGSYERFCRCGNRS